jgi:thiol-disulfide isomerase/thioredoxin
VYLKKYHGRDEILMDSIGGSGVFSFRISSELPLAGLYLISSSKSEVAELMIDPKEKGLRVTIDKAGLKNGTISISGSLENEAYSDFVRFYLDYEQGFYELAQLPFDKYDPKLVSKLQSQSLDMEDRQAAFNEVLETLIEKYPNTFTANVLCPLAQRPIRNSDQLSNYDTYLAFLKDGYWNGSLLSDDRLLNHFLLNECMKNYFRYFVPKSEAAIKEAIDILLSASERSESVSAHVRSFLLRNFLNSNATELSLYVNQKAGSDLCQLNLTNEELAKLESMNARIDTGSTVPNVVLSGLDNALYPLQTVYEQNKVTVILFWSANCVHCVEEMPVLSDIYGSFRERGMGIYSINLDENKFPWRDFLAENPSPWVNVTDTGPLHKSTLINQFGIHRTPSSFVIDSAGRILAKNLFGDALRDFLEDHLSER